MKRLAIPLAGAGLVLILAAGAVAAATPPPTAPVATTAPGATPAPVQAPGTVAAILGLTDAQVMALRQQGLSLAQIAEQQKVDPQRLVDALVAQWSARIDARLAVGAITADQAKTLKSNVATLAKAMVNQTTLGGMRGAAVGAGPNGGMRGMGAWGRHGRRRSRRDDARRGRRDRHVPAGQHSTVELISPEQGGPATWPPALR